MGSSAKLLHAPLNRHLLSLNPHLRLSSRSLLSFPNRNPNPNPRNSLNLSQIGPRSAPFSSSSLLSQLFSSNPPKSPPPDPIQGAFHVWDRAIDADEGGGDERFLAEGGAAWTVVLLGWLGAEHKHLKRYAEIYNGRGIRSVRFVVPVKELIGLDLGRRVEERIGVLASDLARWCAETEEDGRERRLLFHTFSNTGWLAYGSILENWQSRSDLLEKIDGCVVDSGPAPELSPQVWAAGFGAALLKKRSSLIYSDESNKGDNKDGPAISETIVLAILEKFFCVILNLPEIKQRLNRIISALSKNQPSCPQLYLYSSADKVVPVRSVEGFIQQQKDLGRTVHSHDFGSSPHVDHFRNFPHIYSDKVADFLEECLSRTILQKGKSQPSKHYSRAIIVQIDQTIWLMVELFEIKNFSDKFSTYY